LIATGLIEISLGFPAFSSPLVEYFKEKNDASINKLRLVALKRSPAQLALGMKTFIFPQYPFIY